MSSIVNSTEINLAVYMERLDAYIESQNTLNTTLCSSLENVHNSLDDFKYVDKNQSFYGKILQNEAVSTKIIDWLALNLYNSFRSDRSGES